MAQWYQKAIFLGNLVLVTHAKAVQLVVYAVGWETSQIGQLKIEKGGRMGQEEG